MKTNYVIKHIVGSLIFFAILFICAGRINYWQGYLDYSNKTRYRIIPYIW